MLLFYSRRKRRSVQSYTQSFWCPIRVIFPKTRRTPNEKIFFCESIEKKYVLENSSVRLQWYVFAVDLTLQLARSFIRIEKFAFFRTFLCPRYSCWVLIAYRIETQTPINMCNLLINIFKRVFFFLFL